MSEESSLKVDIAQQSEQDRAYNMESEEQRESQEKKEEYPEQEDDDQDIPQLPSNLLPKQPQRQKLIEQNIKLKAQIYELALQLDEILIKDKQKKKKYGLPTQDDDDQAVKAAKLQLKKQQLKVIQTKNYIFELKRQLDSVFNNTIVQEKQDRLKDLNRVIQELEQEKDGLLKIKKGQAKAIKTIKNEQQYKQKIDKVHKEYIKRKQETQKLIERVLEARKREIDCHQSYVVKRGKVRELQAKMAANKQKGKQKQKTKGKNTTQQQSRDTISNEMIAELQNDIKQLEKEKREGEKVWQDKIRAIEGELQAKRQEQQRKMLILREKEKEYKLNEIRIRELRKLVKQNIINENMYEKRRGQDMDMSQFRHKRNIRYMEK